MSDASKNTLRSLNPATDALVAEYAVMSEAEVDDALARATEAQAQWSRTTDFEARAAVLTRAAEGLEADREALAALMTAEMGKPIAQGRSEVDKCAWVCRYYARNAASQLASEPIETEFSRSYVAFRPLGLVLAVMPWNFPLWQVFRFAAPALMAGNGGVLKHASNVMGCALAIERIFSDAGAPSGLFTALRIGSDRVEAVIEDRRIAAVTLTGSTPAGRAVASAAGRALKKTVLELGGSDPYVLLEDADIEHAAKQCVASRLINSGQSCIAAKRFIVPRSIHAAFVEAVVSEMSARTLGDPTRDGTDIGPQARTDLRDELHAQVLASVAAGAKLRLGGECPTGPGAFYPATVLDEVGPGMPAYDEELFGPVAAILPVADETEALRVANDTEFGLGAAIFTRDHARGETLAREQLDAGACFVDDFVRSDPRLPFGGIGASGYGRELAAFGIREFVNIKTVVVR